MTPIPASAPLPVPTLLTATWAPGSCGPGEGAQGCNAHARGTNEVSCLCLTPSCPHPYIWSPSFLSLATTLKGKKRPRAVGDLPTPLGHGLRAPSPALSWQQPRMGPSQNLPPHTGGPKLMGWLWPQEPCQFWGAQGLPREGEFGQRGGREKRHKKKLNILKIYIYRFVFTSSPQIKSSKSTLKQLGGERGRRGEEGNTGGSLQPKCPWRSSGHSKAGR